eukprot:TRINITY_DN13419_c0_g1_i1.p2 TRINITY_DN13419_c0_g1~~TRINITY_DN13419_c0_g1_i1.p2  ORF type:complete len:295 (+),score=69.98 TRINITY_DN13419_c0_g1_i1:47-886(+)
MAAAGRPCQPGAVWFDGANAYTDVAVPASFRRLALPAHQVFRAMASARWSVLEEGWLGLAAARRAGKCRFYVVGQSVRLSKGLAQRAPDALMAGCVCRCRLQLVKVGNTSFTMKTLLTVMMPGEAEAPPLTAAGTLVYVFVDAETSQKTPIPPALKPALSAALAEGEDPGARPPRDAPAPDAAGPPRTYTTTLRPSDTDFNGHVNQAVHAQLLSDAMEAAQGAEPVLEHVDLQYSKEMNAGDAVQVRWWRAGPCVRFELVGEGVVHASGRATLLTDASL